MDQSALRSGQRNHFIPWLCRLIRLEPQRSLLLDATGPDDNWQDTVPMERPEMENLFSVGLSDMEDDPPPGTDARYFLEVARRRLEPARRQTLLWYHQNSRPQ